MDFPEVRKFLLASYHDLPNVLFVGSLILGSLLGYLPLVWLALGLIFNGVITSIGQYGIQMLLEAFPSTFDKFKDQLKSSGLQRCNVGFQYPSGESPAISNFTSPAKYKDGTIIAPSYWVSASIFFAMFSIYNSIRVTMRDPKGRADPLLVSTRKAFSLSTLFIGIFFMIVVFARYYTGCETIVGLLLGIVVGGATAISFWHILDACGTGKLPDVLQVVGSMAPDQSKTETPVMCSAAPE